MLGRVPSYTKSVKKGPFLHFGLASVARSTDRSTLGPGDSTGSDGPIVPGIPTIASAHRISGMPAVGPGQRPGRHARCPQQDAGPAVIGPGDRAGPVGGPPAQEVKAVEV